MSLQRKIFFCSRWEELTNRKRFSVVCTLINNDIRHYSGQTVATISTSNKTILSVRDQDRDTLTRAACLNSYRQRQIGDLWRRANARNINLFTLYGVQFTFSTQLLTLYYLRNFIANMHEITLMITNSSLLLYDAIKSHGFFNFFLQFQRLIGLVRPKHSLVRSSLLLSISRRD